MSVRLSRRERQFLYLAGQRLSDAQIAADRGVAIKTVSNALARTYQKLGVHDRIRAAARLSELYPRYPMPLGYHVEAPPDDDLSAQDVGEDRSGLPAIMAALPRPPNWWRRLSIIMFVAIVAAVVAVGLSAIMRVVISDASAFSPADLR